ncbi:MAG: class I SAM-dependent methyltransferase [Gammaproteobacteria bacterium]|nr:class I SAM-dependent methyltransferase [Gammaproteobacteria bacterium]
MVGCNVDPGSVRGYLHPEEGQRLYDLAAGAARHAPCLEIGSYCGKSTLYLGTACRDAGGVLFALDHHRGSEEHQLGEAYHEPALFDESSGRMDSLPEFRRNLARANLEDTVVALVASSATVAAVWSMPLSLVFIDGGHSRTAALADYRGWSGHVIPGGILAIHDLFDNPADGGQAPMEIYRLAVASGLFDELPRTHTLGVLQRR